MAKPSVQDERWRHHADHDVDEHHVHQEWRLVDDGQERRHVEEFVNRRARTERPPA